MTPSPTEGRGRASFFAQWQHSRCISHTRPLPADRLATGSARTGQLGFLPFVGLCILVSPPSRNLLLNQWWRQLSSKSAGCHHLGDGGDPEWSTKTSEEESVVLNQPFAFKTLSMIRCVVAMWRLLTKKHWAPLITQGLDFFASWLYYFCFIDEVDCIGFSSVSWNE